ncbi:MAG TPA: helix-turn-helix domain-containing protein [Bacillota bacterium]|nr:helix-turn-helix domain-containing protein [Bacillota bacterium]
MASKEVRRTMIMEAAIERFSRQGFHAAKIEDIAATAAIGKGTVYEYFSSKQHLFHDSLDYLLALYNEGLYGTMLSATDLNSGLRAFVDYQMRAYDGSICLIQSLAAMPVSLTEELRLLWERQQRETLLCLEKFMSRVMPIDDAKCRDGFALAATVIYGSVNQYCLQRMFTGRASAHDHYSVDVLVQMIEHGVRGGSSNA